MNLQQKLSDGLNAMGLALPQAAQDKLLDYVALLAKWNKVHNLTAVRDPQEMLSHHLLDSLSVLGACVLVQRLAADMHTVDAVRGLTVRRPSPSMCAVLTAWTSTRFLSGRSSAAGFRNHCVRCERVS